MRYFRLIAIVCLFFTFCTTSAAASQRWQQLITTDNYRCYFDGQTIAFKSKDYQEVLTFKLQKVYWHPEQLTKELQLLDNTVDWSRAVYSVEQDSYNLKRHLFWSGDIAFFTKEGTFIGLIRRDQWQKVVAQSELAQMCNRLARYAKENKKQLRNRS